MDRKAIDQLQRRFGDNNRHPIRHGMVVDVAAADGLVKVSIEPEGDLTGWIRYVGPGLAFGKWQAAMLPAVDTEVLLVAVDTDCSSFVAVGGIYNEEDKPPADAAVGAVVFAHTNGVSKLLLKDDGTIHILSATVLLGDDAAIQLANVHLKEWGEALIAALNTQLSAIKVHAHGGLVSPDPTLVGIGGLSAPDGTTITTKVKGS